MTFSRSAALGALVAVGAFLALPSKFRPSILRRARTATLIGLSVAVALATVVPHFNTYQSNRVSRTLEIVTPTVGGADVYSDSSFRVRIAQVGVGQTLFLERPLLGHGFRTQVHTFLDNQYSILMAETGILGLVAFLFYWSSLMRFSFRFRRYWLPSATFALVLGLSISAIGAEVFFVPRIVFTLLFVVVLAGASIKHHTIPRQVENPKTVC